MITDMPKVRGTAFFLILLSIGIRIYFLPYSNGDMDWFNVPWYQTLYEQGVSKTLGTNFSNYSPPYTYLLALATWSHDFIPALIAIKLIPTFFDMIGAVLVYKIVSLKYPDGQAALLAASLYFIAPTVMLNSSHWGQVDSLYTFFLLLCIHYLLLNRPLPAMIAHGIAFAIKAQAMFLAPFLIILAFQKRIPWKYLLMTPAMYLAGILPVVLLGRPLPDALLIYAKQSVTYNKLSMNAPNLWFIFLNDRHQLRATFGILIAALLVLYWIYVTIKKDRAMNNNKLVLYAMLAVTLTPFLLPKMHDRYFYPADVLSIVLAFYWPALWFIPVLYQVISFIPTSHYLFDTSADIIVFSSLLNIFAIAFLLRAQTHATQSSTPTPHVPVPVLKVVAGMIPFFLFGLPLNLMPTLHSAMVYQEISQIIELKNKLQDLQQIWHVSLVILYMLGLLAWAGNWLAEYRLAAGRGGFLAMYLSPVLGVSTLLWLNNHIQKAYEHPISLDDWRNIILFSIFFSIGAGWFLGNHLVKRGPAHEQY
jgi:Gpi18-like mannosyltransferase